MAHLIWPFFLESLFAWVSSGDYKSGLLSERGAAWLAHQSGGLGVPSSNLGAPTNIPPFVQSTEITNNAAHAIIPTR
jgi:hypothetical protein